MDIDDVNLIVKDVMFHNITQSEKKMKLIDEFGSYKYFMNADLDKAEFAFDALDFETIYNYSGKDYFEKQFPEFIHVLNNTQRDGNVYNIAFSIPLERYRICHEKVPKNISEEEKSQYISAVESLRKELNEFAETISNKFARFRVDLYSSIIIKFVSEIEKGQVSDPIKVRLNLENIIMFIPNKERLSVAFGMNFPSKTDHNLAKLFFRELEDAKIQGFTTLEVKYFNQQYPDELLAVEKNVKNFPTGFVVFCNIFYFQPSTQKHL